MEHVQVPFIDIAWDEDVERLRLADERRAIGGEFDDPALVDFERGLEDILLVLVEAICVLIETVPLTSSACLESVSEILWQSHQLHCHRFSNCEPHQ